MEFLTIFGITATLAIGIELYGRRLVSRFWRLTHYEHHGKTVAVRKGLKGKHREYCLCYTCARFSPEPRTGNCEIANQVFKACVEHTIVTPVWECPEYKELV